ncbi:histone deacetylase family protein [Ferruginivarius sediminum]|uniref:Histone deacetylase family protein n=1 Tax=Ferruginivarius sediminum TaxID=2661937 RepID=A0A369TCQ0_9PROT|nr:histone deacetylase family protein [Ferruginivarius sediminum]RDD63113.1 histone deacetylase family protein [Ferruginivarius sediminum]
MKTVYSENHHRQHGRGELTDGYLMPVVEKPERAEMILARVKAEGLGEVVAPHDFGREPLAAVHDAGYLDFLENAWDAWEAEHGGERDALPLIWPVRTLRQARPENIDGKIGYYAMDAGTPITAGTWQAATTSAKVSLTAASLVHAGAPSAFALGRPPGHHAAADLLGGYCFLNNAAIAAQWLRDQGVPRVAILDVDYHHGNGTQAIFDDRADVFFASIHADPRQEFPYFLGHADETGSGAGEGHTANFPLPWGTEWPAYAEALDAACRRIEDYGPDVLVVSLGVDTFERDPISRFRLSSGEFPRIGARLAGLKRPTVFVMEGGYAVEEIGVNALGVLAAFEGG